MSSREKKSWEWGRKQRESGRALRGSSVAQGDPLPVSGVASGAEAIWWARAGAYKRADVGGAYGVVVSGIAAASRSVWSAGVWGVEERVAGWKNN